MKPSEVCTIALASEVGNPLVLSYSTAEKFSGWFTGSTVFSPLALDGTIFNRMRSIKNKYKQRFQLLLCRALSVTLIQASFSNPRLSSSCSDVLNGTATVATVSPPSLGAIVGLPPRIISCLCRMFSNVVCGSLSSAGTNAAVIVRDLGRVAGQPFFICKGRCGK